MGGVGALPFPPKEVTCTVLHFADSWLGWPRPGQLDAFLRTLSLEQIAISSGSRRHPAWVTAVEKIVVISQLYGLPDRPGVLVSTGNWSTSLLSGLRPDFQRSPLFKIVRERWILLPLTKRAYRENQELRGRQPEAFVRPSL